MNRPGFPKIEIAPVALVSDSRSAIERCEHCGWPMRDHDLESATLSCLPGERAAVRVPSPEPEHCERYNTPGCVVAHPPGGSTPCRPADDDAFKPRGVSTMPPKNPAFVQENVRRAAVAWRELGERLTDPADRERLRILKLAIHDLDELQTELHELVANLVDCGVFTDDVADAHVTEAKRRLEAVRAKGDPA